MPRVLSTGGDSRARAAGGGADRAAWTNLGHATGAPASRNTWAATPSGVA